MAIRPDWTSGTLTLVAGSKDFTTTGSALETAALQAGDAIITVSGYVLIIEAITGQNSGTLYAECPVAAAGSDQPLRIRYQPDGSRVQGAMRMVRELLTSGNLEAFAALAGEEDAVPVFVGPGVIKLVPKSEFGPDDTKGNLAAVAQLDSIQNLTEVAELADISNLTEVAELTDIRNLTELAALAKANEQFVVMDADGKIAIKSIKSLTDEIDKKYQLPEGGTAQQLLSGAGSLIEPANLPVSTATQNALDGKFEKSGGNVSGSIHAVGDITTNGDFWINDTSVKARLGGAARAWVRFNESGVILASYNVSSVTLDAPGRRFIVNFTTPMPDANYAVVASSRANTGISYGGMTLHDDKPTANNVTVISANWSANSTYISQVNSVVVFR